MSREHDPHSQALPPAVRRNQGARTPLISEGEYLPGAEILEPQAASGTDLPDSRAGRVSAKSDARKRKATVPATPPRPAYPPDWPVEEDWRHDPRGGIVHTCYGNGRIQRVNQRGSEHERRRCAYCRQPWKLEDGRWVRV